MNLHVFRFVTSNKKMYTRAHSHTHTHSQSRTRGSRTRRVLDLYLTDADGGPVGRERHIETQCMYKQGLLHNITGGSGGSRTKNLHLSNTNTPTQTRLEMKNTEVGLRPQRNASRRHHTAQYLLCCPLPVRQFDNSCIFTAAAASFYTESDRSVQTHRRLI